jgi:hypothetical protein
MNTKTKTIRTLEVHEHCVIRGPRSNKSWLNKFSHSHAGGTQPHGHPDCGPASYTIDKDEWARATGLKGGGRKVYTAKPKGEQFPIEALEDWQTTFEIHVDEESCRRVLEGTNSTGAGVGPAARMVLAFKMKPTFPDDDGSDDEKAVSP